MSKFCVKCTIFVFFVKFLFKTSLILTIPKATENYQFCRNPNLVVRVSIWLLDSHFHRYPLIFELALIFINVFCFLVLRFLAPSTGNTFKITLTLFLSVTHPHPQSFLQTRLRLLFRFAFVALCVRSCFQLANY